MVSFCLFCLLFVCYISSFSSGWSLFSPQCGYTVKDLERLRSVFNERVFGQSVAINHLLGVLNLHKFGAESISKPLLINFNGHSGVGKSLTSSFLKDLYLSTEQYNHFHMFVGNDYKKEKITNNSLFSVEETIRQAVELCEYSLFIYEDIQSADPPFFDGLLPIFKGTKYPSKSIHIFISNLGAKVLDDLIISSKAKRLDLNSIPKHEFKRVILSDMISQGHFIQSKEYFQDFIPFFPIERESAELCILAELRNLLTSHRTQKKLSDLHLTYAGKQYLLDNLTYKKGTAFVVQGCYRVKTIVTDATSKFEEALSQKENRFCGYYCGSYYKHQSDCLLLTTRKDTFLTPDTNKEMVTWVMDGTFGCTSINSDEDTIKIEL